MYRISRIPVNLYQLTIPGKDPYHNIKSDESLLPETSFIPSKPRTPLRILANHNVLLQHRVTSSLDETIIYCFFQLRDENAHLSEHFNS